MKVIKKKIKSIIRVAPAMYLSGWCKDILFKF